MTARQVWEGMLTELSKTGSPSMLLLDFNYFFNKAINLYINKRYNIYDINQQTTDDLRVLKSSTTLTPAKIKSTGGAEGMNFLGFGAGASKIYGATYEVYLPLDYLHMLNCVCLYELKDRFKCYDKGDIVPFKATRLTADLWSNVINDYYNRPLPERPYFYIHNVNTSDQLPTNPIDATKDLERTTVGTDSKQDYKSTAATGTTQTAPATEATIGTTTGTVSNLPRTISLNGITNNSLVEKEAGQRYGNASGVRCEIRYGHDDSVFKLVGVAIDYIKSPQVIRLTQEQVNLTKDTSQIMEFPDYVCQEIINELTMLVMENTADPRLQTNTQVTLSIANPAAQGLQQPQALAAGRQRQG